MKIRSVEVIDDNSSTRVLLGNIPSPCGFRIIADKEVPRDEIWVFSADGLWMAIKIDLSREVE